MKTNSMATGPSIGCTVPFAMTLAAALAGAGACGGEPPPDPADESVSVETRAFSTSSCAAATADPYLVHPEGYQGLAPHRGDDALHVGFEPHQPVKVSVTSLSQGDWS